MVQNPVSLGSHLPGQPDPGESGSGAGESYLECLSHLLTAGFSFPSHRAVFPTRRGRGAGAVRSSPSLSLDQPLGSGAESVRRGETGSREGEPAGESRGAWMHVRAPTWLGGS